MSANSNHLMSLVCSARNRFSGLTDGIRKLGYEVIITSSYRSPEKQAALYKDLKNQKGGRAARPGKSKHNQAIAIDINIKKDGKWWKKATPKGEWEDSKVPELARKMGFRWGGDFTTNYDPVHFDLGNDYKINELSGKLQSLKEVPLSTQFSCAIEGFMKNFKVTN